MTNPILNQDKEGIADSSDYLIDEVVLDNSIIENIIRGKLRDPLISSDDEVTEPAIDWDAIWQPMNKDKARDIYVPGLRPPPTYPKLSVLTEIQHRQLLKVLCAKHPHILEQQFINKPTENDHNAYNILKPIYEIEQKEFIEWAKSLWVDEHYTRALCLKPVIETVYEAEFKMRVHKLSGFPTCFDMATEIPLEYSNTHQYDIQLIQTLLDVNVSELPLVKLPQPILKKMSVIEAYSRPPEPCFKHPCQFILPNADSVSTLPITELHYELAQYAAENGTNLIASENALRCLLQLNKHWIIPVTVCEVVTPDGENCNVVVIDSEFSIHKEPAMTRTYKAMKHLLDNKLILAGGETKKPTRKKKHPRKIESQRKYSSTSIAGTSNSSIMGTANTSTASTSSTSMAVAIDDLNPSDDENSSFTIFEEDNGMTSADITMEAVNDIIGVYSDCACNRILYKPPPRRSFKKWRLKNIVTSENIDLIVHCAHKARNRSNEVVLEPIPEYQLEMGGSEQPPDRIRALVLALIFRENADVVNVRLDASNGEIVTIDLISTEDFIDAHSEKHHQVLNIMHTSLSELQGLYPGHYLLQHAPSHGANALFHVNHPSGSVKLDFTFSQLAEAEETKMAKMPPIIAPVLMPHHKFRNILPCAFTPFEEEMPPQTERRPPIRKNPNRKVKKTGTRRN